MSELKKTLNLASTSYYETHVAIVNTLAGTSLTGKEVELLAFFVANGGVTTVNRKQAREQFGYSTSNLSNYLKTFRDKRVVVKDKKYLIQKAFYPSKTTQSYSITINETNDQSDSV